MGTDWVAQASKVALGGDLDLRGAVKSVTDMAASGGFTNAGYWLDPNNAIPQALSIRGAAQIAEAGARGLPKSYELAKKSIFSLYTPQELALKNPLRDYLWSFWVKGEFERGQNYRNVFKRINKVNLPGVEFDVIEKIFANQRFAMAGIKGVGKINLTIYEDADGAIKSLEYLYKWHNQIQDPASGGIYPPGHYKKTAIIAVYRLLTNQGKASDMTAMWMEVHGVWPSSIADIQLDYAGNGLFTIEATLTIDQIGRVWFAGAQGSSALPASKSSAPWANILSGYGEDATGQLLGGAVEAVKNWWGRVSDPDYHEMIPEIPEDFVEFTRDVDQSALAAEDAAARARAIERGIKL